MKSSFHSVLCAILIAAAIGGAESADAPKTPGDAQLISRGHYLVNQVTMCADCHSPRDEKGAYIPGREFTGSSLVMAPLAPMPWAAYAPGIAGLPAGWTAAQMTQFLMTGARPFDMPPVNPPMPAYRLNQADAEAVTAYLLSLAPPKK